MRQKGTPCNRFLCYAVNGKRRSKETGEETTSSVFLCPRKLGGRDLKNEKVADTEEVLAALTSILRRENEARPGEVLKAAELLGKQYGLFGERDWTDREAPCIVMNVPRKRRDKGGSQG